MSRWKRFAIHAWIYVVNVAFSAYAASYCLTAYAMYANFEMEGYSLPRALLTLLFAPFLIALFYAMVLYCAFFICLLPVTLLMNRRVASSLRTRKHAWNILVFVLMGEIAAYLYEIVRFDALQPNLSVYILAPIGSLAFYWCARKTRAMFDCDVPQDK